MEPLFAIVIGLLVAASAYMFLARDLPRCLIGFVLLGTAANLTIFAAGRIGSMTPPLVAPGGGVLTDAAANPLPQALVLTAIVIGFGLAAFALTLIVKANEAFGAARSEDMTAAEGPARVEPATKTLEKEAA